MKSRQFLFTALIFVFIFVFSSCGETGLFPVKPKEPPPVTYPGSYTLDISFGEFSGKADMSYESYAVMSMSFCEPETINGFTIKLENMVYTYEIYGAATTHRVNNVPANAVPTMIFSAVQVLLKKEYTSAYTDEDGWCYEGIASGFTFLAKQNPETGLLKELSISSQNLSVVFISA